MISKDTVRCILVRNQQNKLPPLVWITVAIYFWDQVAKLADSMQWPDSNAWKRRSKTVSLSSICRANVAQTYFENILTADFKLNYTPHEVASDVISGVKITVVLFYVRNLLLQVYRYSANVGTRKRDSIFI